jgi:hypothetical protein
MTNIKYFNKIQMYSFIALEHIFENVLLNKMSSF